MWKPRLFVSASLILPALVASGCSGKDEKEEKDCPAGHEDCDCTAESTCLTGLVCESGTCVAGAMQGTGGSGSGQTGCVACWDAECPSEHDTCEATEACDELTECLLECIAN